jgi:uncharacterized membrane protein
MRNLQKETSRMLTLSALFSCLLVVARIIHTGRLTFGLMPWNLFLAYVPYFISTMFTQHGQEINKGLKAVVLIIWLLFIPNSFYILTDLFHLADNHRDPRVPEWFDLVLILSFAWNGLVLGILSIRQVEKLLAPQASSLGRWVFLCPVMALNSFGVYIGRYLRYNSWDVVTSPVDLLVDIIRIVVHPLRYRDAWDMIVCYSVLLTLMYSLLTKIANHGKYDLPILEP